MTVSGIFVNIMIEWLQIDDKTHENCVVEGNSVTGVLMDVRCCMGSLWSVSCVTFHIFLMSEIINSREMLLFEI